VVLKKEWGIPGDAHAGTWHRQISLLSQEAVDEFNRMGAKVSPGAFGENFLVKGYDLKSLRIGTILQSKNIVLQVTQIGKQCHSGCDIAKRMGKCIMPVEGIFARVLKGGMVAPGEELVIHDTFRVALLTISDKGSQGERKDESGPMMESLLDDHLFTVVSREILPDEQTLLAERLSCIADEAQADLVLTSGGTGLSPRDVTPEATLSIADKIVPGIPEAMRARSLSITDRGMLSRSACVIRSRTLIVNLPGSPKAVKENLSAILLVLPHALGTMMGFDVECASQS